ncbi:MAG TPA: hypothetical protein VHX63_01945 [Acidobacteriaceae bacterium]|jgi:hypothetical protein|nr:hypothetical protein [Acidobacteriaceae bacterium]
MNRKFLDTPAKQKLVGSCASLFHAAEKEMTAFVYAVDQLFGAESSWRAAEYWIEQLETIHSPGNPSVSDLRHVTIAAASRLAGTFCMEVA